MTSVAGAEPKAGDATASAYQQGRAAMLAKNWDEAYRILLPLWKEHPTYEVALNLGQTELYLGKYRDAAEHLAHGLKNLPLNLEQRDEIEQRGGEALDAAKQHIAVLKIRVNQDAAEVRVGARVIGRSPLDLATFVEPGPTTIEAELPGYQLARQTVDARAGMELTAVLHLEPMPSSGAPPGGPESATNDTRPVQANDDGLEARTVVLSAGAAFGTIALGTTIVVALNRASASSRAEDAQAVADGFGPNACGRGTAPASTCADLDDALADKESAGKLINIAAPIAAITLAGTAVAFFVWPKEKRKTASNVMFVPQLTPRGGGVQIHGSF